MNVCESMDYDRSYSSRNPNFDGKATFFHKTSVDTYSLGIIFWELENCIQPFEKESMADVYRLLIDEKVRPRINSESNK